MKISLCCAIMCKSQIGILPAEINLDIYTSLKEANSQSKLVKWINLNKIST